MEKQFNPGSIRVTLEERDGYLRFTVSGLYNFEDFKVLVTAFRDESILAKVGKALLDVRQLQGSVPNIDRYNLGQLFAKTWAEVLKMGIIGRPDHEDPLFENTAVNRYAQVMVNDDERTVLDWLLAPEPPAPGT